MGVNLKTRIFLSDPLEGSPIRNCDTLRRGTTYFHSYDISSYSEEMIEQVTFMLKQADTLRWYELYNYFEETTDAVAQEGAEYFRGEKQTAGWQFTPLDLTPGDPVPEHSYVKAELADVGSGEQLPRQVDAHFCLKNGVIEFHLNPEETAGFEPSDLTEIESFICFQIAIKLDTDTSDITCGRDTVTVVDQPPIIIRDSLYAEVLPYTGPSICSERLYASDWTICKN